MQNKETSKSNDAKLDHVIKNQLKQQTKVDFLAIAVANSTQVQNIQSLKKG